MVKIRYKDGTSEEIRDADGVKRGLRRIVCLPFLKGMIFLPM